MPPSAELDRPDAAEVDWPVWLADQEPAALGGYVVPDAVALHAAVPAGSPESATTRLRAVWAVLREIGVGYAHEPAGAEPGGQRIRTPGEVLVAPRAGTCLDLALVLAGGCEHAGLPAAVILLSPAGGGAGHALVAVGLSRRWPLAGVWTAPPDGIAGAVAASLAGAPRDVVVVDPNGLARSLGASAAVGLDTDLDAAVGSGYAYLTDARWVWQMSVAAGAGGRYRPAAVPGVLPLREIYQRADTADSVLRLVRAEYALTPFQGRDELTVLEDFSRRVAAGDRTGLVVIHGAGGSGKTRLGLELADRLRRVGWYAGPLREFLTQHERENRSPSLTWLARVTAPLMVMVDYADAHADDLNLLLATVRNRSGPPAVVIATARSIDGDWLADVRDALSAVYRERARSTAYAEALGTYGKPGARSAVTLHRSTSEAAMWTGMCPRGAGTGIGLV